MTFFSPPQTFHCHFSFTFLLWSGRRDSNPRQPAWKAGTLPTELLPQNRIYFTSKSPACQSGVPASSKAGISSLVDGIGFSSNRAGLDDVLSVADEFCQYRTIWKSIVVCSVMSDIPLIIELPRTVIEQRQDFLKRFNFLKLVVAKENGHQAKLRIQVGEGAVLLNQRPS